MRIKAAICFIGLLVLLIGLIFPTSASLAMPTSGAISGTTSYSGSYDPDHEVLVAAHPDPDSEPIASVHILGPGEYSLDDLPDGSYYISAFLDIHDRGEGPPGFGEPTGWYDSNEDGTPDQVTVNGGDITGINIVIADIDSEYIQGTACYLGGVDGPGPLEVALHLSPADPPVVSQYVSRPCDDYIFNGGPAGTYYVSLFFDVNHSGGPPEPGEPIGWYDPDEDGTPDPVIYTGNVITDVNITVGGIHYVDFSATGNEDGSSWDDAFRNLQDALAIADRGEEIWVAAGNYTPGSTRDASFVLKHGVAVYGGFSGTEDYRHQRNLGANKTVLSGEIGDPNTKIDNAYHVVTTASTFENPVDETTILDGFTITGGYANVDAGQTEKGGGFLNSFGHPFLVNLNFINNYALNHGGAIASQYNSEPLQIVNCMFSGNSATNNAGGVANLSQVAVLNSSFIGNTGANGGGIVNLSGAHAEIHNSILWNNQGNDIALQGTATVSTTYSVVDGGFPSGSHISTADPLFVDADGPDGVFGTWDDDLHLQSTSPAIDAGDNSRLANDEADSDGNGNTIETIPLDPDGFNRLVDEPGMPDNGNGIAPLVDKGADEYAQPAAISGLHIVANAPTLLGEATALAARTPGGTHVAYAWDFGDGNVASNGLQTHLYSMPGVYPVTLTATNNLGSQQAHTEITVYESLTMVPGSSQTTADGALTIEVPLSVTSAMTISYTPQITYTQLAGSFYFGGLAFQLQATDHDGNPIITPGSPLTITVQYDDSTLPAGVNEAALELYRYDEGFAQWIALTTLSRDLAGNTISLLLDHFSEFALLVEKPDSIEYKTYLPVIQH